MFIGVIISTDAFSNNTDTLQWIGYSYNYARKSAICPHAYIKALMTWMFLWISITNYTRYASALRVSAQQCRVSQRTAASVKELLRIAGYKRFIKNQWLTKERIIFKTVFLKIKACDLCSFIYGDFFRILTVYQKMF